ncbi:MAG: hypothetical protein AAGJ55_01245 [Cyanobacteria bacterium J06555_12]
MLTKSSFLFSAAAVTAFTLGGLAIDAVSTTDSAQAVVGNQLQWDCFRKSDNEFSFGSHSDVSNSAVLCVQNPDFDPTPPQPHYNNPGSDATDILTILFLNSLLDRLDDDHHPADPHNPPHQDPPHPEEPTPGPIVDLYDDCIAYNPFHLELRDEGANGWLLTDGNSRMQVLDDYDDASEALAVARRHTHHCFIGRGNNRPERRRYITEYWLGDSGINAGQIGGDCRSYNPANIRIVDEGANGWLLTDGISRMDLLDTLEDAELALGLAREHSSRCFVGRSNDRPNRTAYILEYWL